MNPLSNKNGILSRMKILHVYLTCFFILLIFYLARVRIVDGYLCFDNPTGIYAVFLIVLSVFVMIIAWIKTPWVKYVPIERPRNKLIIDLIVITGLSLLLIVHGFISVQCAVSTICVLIVRHGKSLYPHTIYWSGS